MVDAAKPRWRIAEAVAAILVVITVLISLASGIAALFPARLAAASALRQAAALAIFAGSYLALAIGGIPGLKIDRAGAALAGAGLMIAAGVLPLEAAYRAIDLDTITLLLGVMIVVASLRLSGFFAAVTAWAAAHAHRPGLLLVAVTGIAGVFSAVLVNDAICLVLAPLVLDLALRMGRQPVPYLLAVAMAANVGSTATITGNPQNIMIGGLSRLPYLEFAAALTPVAVVGLVVTAVLIRLGHRDEFAAAPAAMPAPPPGAKVNRRLIARALGATVVMLALFLAGVAPAKAAIAIGGLLLLTPGLKSRRFYAEIDWPLLVMFAGLFIITAAAERTFLSPGVIAAAGELHLDRVPVLAGICAVLSNLVSNVPAVLILRPFITPLADHRHAWLVVAMASTLAGNFTVLGSVANLIVVEKAAARGVTISFWAYFRIGAPLTLITLAIGTLWLMR